MNKNDIFVLGVGEVLYDMLPSGKQCGGAPANVIYHLNKLGINCAVVSAVGRDELGDELLGFLSSRQVCTDFITRNELPTGTVQVTLNNGIPQYEICHPVAWDAIEIAPALYEKLPQVSAVIFGSLSQRDERSGKNIMALLEALPEKCLKVFDINLRQKFFTAEIIRRSLEIADVLKINDEELIVVAEMFDIEGDTKTVLNVLKERFSLKSIILTLGAAGSMFFDGKDFSEYPVKPCTVVDTVGCGDAFLAAWCGAILQGHSDVEAMEKGSELASYVASHAGAMC